MAKPEELISMVEEVRRAFEEIMDEMWDDRGRLIEKIEELVINGEEGFSAEETLLIANLLLNLEPTRDEEAHIKDVSLIPHEVYVAAVDRMPVMVVHGENPIEGLRDIFQPQIVSLLKSCSAISRRKANGRLNIGEISFLEDCRYIRGDEDRILALVTNSSSLVDFVFRARRSEHMSCDVFDRLALIVSECVCSCIEMLATNVLSPGSESLASCLHLVEGLMVFAAHMEDEDESRIAGDDELRPSNIHLHIGRVIVVDGLEGSVSLHPVTGRPCPTIRARCASPGCEELSDWAYLGYTEEGGWTQVMTRDDIFLCDLRVMEFVCEKHRAVEEPVHIPKVKADLDPHAVEVAPMPTILVSEADVKVLPNRPLDYNEACRILDVPNGTMYSAIHFYETLPAEGKVVDPIVVARWYNERYSPRGGKKKTHAVVEC